MQSFEREMHKRDLEEMSWEGVEETKHLVPDSSSSASLKDSKKGDMPRRKEHNRKRRHTKTKVESATAVGSEDEEEEALLEVLDDILQ